MPTPKLTPEIITAAIDGFESQKRRIDDQIAELRSLLHGGSAGATTAPEAPTPKRKKFTAAARRKMALAQKARWAKIKGESGPSTAGTSEPPKPKRKLSAAGRKAIQEAVRKRWAQKRAEAAKVQPAKTTARNKAAVKAVPAKAAKKRAPIKKAAAKKTTAPVAAQAASAAQGGGR